MSRFPSNEDPVDDIPARTGYVVGGVFECDDCGGLSNEAIHSRKEEKLYWKCPEGHENSINFKI